MGSPKRPGPRTISNSRWSSRTRFCKRFTWQLERVGGALEGSEEGQRCWVRRKGISGHIGWLGWLSAVTRCGWVQIGVMSNKKGSKPGLAEKGVEHVLLKVLLSVLSADILENE